MRRIQLVLSSLAVAVMLAACGPGYTTIGVSAGYATPRPRMALVGDGLWVVENQPYPVFYSDGYYWRYYDDGHWAYSGHYDRGWRRSYRVPTAIFRVSTPRAYIRYTVRPGQRHQYVRPYDHRRSYSGRERTWRDYRYRDRYRDRRY
jgi:hypothetical protein